MIIASKLRAIVSSTQDDLKSLAAAAGGDPATFYRGANFNDTDLRGEDLRGFNLEAATFKRARVDRNTLVDEKFSNAAGTERTLTVRMPLGDLLQGLLNSAEIKIIRPTHNQYGDLIEEAIFSDLAKTYIEKKKTFLMPFDREAFLFLTTANAEGRIRNEFLQSVPTLDAIKHSFAVSSDRVVASHFLKYLSRDIEIDSRLQSMRQAALTRRTAEAVRVMSRRTTIQIPELCCALLIAYVSALQLRR